VKVDAAVLVPVYRSADGELRLVLVRRSEGGVHGGHLAFPGGKRDERDKSIRETALREAWEEIGIAAETVDVIAELPIVDARTTGYRVYPFLGRLLNPGQWRRSEREIAEIIDVSLGDLARPDAHDAAMERFSDWPQPREVPFYHVGSHRLWGLSYRILHPLLPRLLGGEWRV
jgi:8-oxo-dGTP pyrophosphatase MutT (NUDIX family)